MNHASASGCRTQPLPSRAFRDNFPPEALARAEEAVSLSAPGNDEHPGATPSDVLLEALASRRTGVGSDSRNWTTSPRLGGDAHSVANIDRCLAGLTGVLDILQASATAAVEGQRHGLSCYHVYNLHLAAEALLSSATNSMERFRERMGVAP